MDEVARDAVQSTVGFQSRPTSRASSKVRSFLVLGAHFLLMIWSFASLSWFGLFYYVVGSISISALPTT